MNTSLPETLESGPAVAQDSNLDQAVSTPRKPEVVHRDFLGRKLAVGDRVIMMAQHSREFKLAQIVKMTPKKVKVAWAEYDWATYTTEPERFVRVEGPDLTWYLITKGV